MTSENAIEQAFQAARNSLLSFCVLNNKNFKTPKHLIKLAKILSQIEKGEKKRVIINLPPRHGKSFLTSQYFPAWYLGKNPDKYIITATYGQEFSDDFGRKVRDTIDTPLFKKIFEECRLKPESKATSRFETTKNGTYFGVGVGGPATGRGAHLLLIDDPIKNREEADSQTMRDKVDEWFRSVAFTRLMPGGACVVIMTRWHEDDLTYRLLSRSNEWELITLPAISDHNEPLWPEAYDLKALLELKNEIGDYNFECLYQQNPMPKEGVLFKAEWLKAGLPSPDDVTATYIAIDPAIGEKETNDETAVVVMQTAYGNPIPIYEVETVHGNFDFNTTLLKIIDLNAKYKPSMIGIEDVAYQKALIQECFRLNLPVFALKAIKDKVARASSISHLFSQGRVYLNNMTLKRQLLSFRGGSEKNDIVDAMVHCLTMIKDFTQIKNEKPDNDKRKELDLRSQELWAYEDKMKQNYQNDNFDLYQIDNLDDNFINNF